MVAGGSSTLLYDIAATRLTVDKSEAEVGAHATYPSSTRIPRRDGADGEREPLLARTSTDILPHDHFGLSIKAGLSMFVAFCPSQGRADMFSLAASTPSSPSSPLSSSFALESPAFAP